MPSSAGAIGCIRELSQNISTLHYEADRTKKLVGGWTNPFETYARQIGFIFPPLWMNIKNIWVGNHHLEKLWKSSNYKAPTDSVWWWFCWAPFKGGLLKKHPTSLFHVELPGRDSENSPSLVGLFSKSLCQVQKNSITKNPRRGFLPGEPRGTAAHSVAGSVASALQASRFCPTRWWLNQPIWKICSSNWVHLPQIGVKKK